MCARPQRTRYSTRTRATPARAVWATRNMWPTNEAYAREAYAHGWEELRPRGATLECAVAQAKEEIDRHGRVVHVRIFPSLPAPANSSLTPQDNHIANYLRA